jgi:hypothetical protein
VSPYYEADGITIYHGDCREIGAWDIAGGVMVTDPPYGYGHASNWPGKFQGAAIANDASEALRDYVLERFLGPAIVFGSVKCSTPAGTRAVLVWDKGPASGMGDLSIPWKPSFELIYVMGAGFAGSRDEGVLKGHHVVTWSGRDGSRQHPNEKPLSLMRALLRKCPPLADVVDPFMGSGTTLRAAKDLGRRAIGIELEERYCEIAANRLAQGVLDFGGAS